MFVAAGRVVLLKIDGALLMTRKIVAPFLVRRHLKEMEEHAMEGQL